MACMLHTLTDTGWYHPSSSDFLDVLLATVWVTPASVCVRVYVHGLRMLLLYG